MFQKRTPLLPLPLYNRNNNTKYNELSLMVKTLIYVLKVSKSNLYYAISKFMKPKVETRGKIEEANNVVPLPAVVARTMVADTVADQAERC